VGSGTTIEWVIFWVIVVGMLALDLWVFNRKAHEIKLREAAIWSVVWIALSLAFNVYVWIDHGSDDALKFFTAYLVEKSLSIDNLFVFLAIFNFFRIPLQHQHRVLFYGVVGALVMRGIFIYAGTALLERFEWMMYLFGAFLIYTGFKLGFDKGEPIDPSKKYLRTTHELHESKFFVRSDGVLLATPLFLVLLVVEFSDVLFAFDSVPAVLGISKDPFIVYSSNIFAILGLRALYFLLAGMLNRLRFLNIGLAAILGFIGLKMVVADLVHIPILLSLGVIAIVLMVSIIASLLAEKREKAK
jgi:tellurite resistance protein TerC